MSGNPLSRTCDRFSRCRWGDAEDNAIGDSGDDGTGGVGGDSGGSDGV